jgi:small subunit ribosomal protein S9
MADGEFQTITVGRRKNASARVFLRPGSGAYRINDKPLPEYFKTVNAQLKVQEPLRTVELADKYDVYCNVEGGGITGQSDAIALGIALVPGRAKPEPPRRVEAPRAADARPARQGAQEVRPEARP